jgi:hypothetical protein
MVIYQLRSYTTNVVEKHMINEQANIWEEANVGYVKEISRRIRLIEPQVN